jgi:myo-inositol-1-phosphate synthase
MTHDGLGKYLSQIIQKAPGATADIVAILKETKTDVVVSYLPVGSEEATKWYVEQVLEAGCAFINCIPVFIASEKYWQKRFESYGLPIIGDDIKSQVGATILHRTLVNLYLDRGMPIDRTYQLNTGGNTDFLNMLERERLQSKKISKTNAVTSQIRARGLEIDPDNVHVGPSDYVPWQKDNKLCFLRIESRHFGDIPTYLDCRLSVEDSPNSGGVVIDAIRCAKLALNNGVSGALFAPASYFMKSPPKQYTDTEARALTEKFITRYARKEVKRQARRKAAPKKK